MEEPISPKEIDDVRKLVREANMSAMKTTGFPRWINLKFAALFSFIVDWAHEVNRDAKRGDDDNYHEEY